MLHHILQCALREEIILPAGVDIAAANRFVEAVFEGASRLFGKPGINAADATPPSHHHSEIERPKATPRKSRGSDAAQKGDQNQKAPPHHSSVGWILRSDAARRSRGSCRMSGSFRRVPHAPIAHVSPKGSSHLTLDVWS